MRTYSDELKANLVERMLWPENASVPALSHERGIPRVIAGSAARPCRPRKSQPHSSMRRQHGIRKASLKSTGCGSAWWCPGKWWFPDIPSFEQLDDRIQHGYPLVERKRPAACEHWLLAWQDEVIE
jgi:hypothetical protein